MPATAPVATPATPAPAPPAFDLEALKHLIEDATAPLRQEVERLHGELAQAKAAQPRFKRTPAEDLHNVAARRAAIPRLARGQEAAGNSQVPVDAHGRRIPDQMLDQWGPAYQPGDLVRVRRDVPRQGMAEGLTWGAVLDKLGCDGEGVVLRQQNLTKLGEWKYTVRVPGLTTADGDGFYAYELMPA